MQIDPPLLDRFRTRLDEAVRRSGLSRSAFAFAAGIDRTTLTQLLSPSNRRLPRLDTVEAIARVHGESIDWLVGLDASGPRHAALIQHTTFHTSRPDPVDEQLLAWLIEAADHRIRYVPATLPDLLKTSAVIRYERGQREAPTAAQRIETTSARLAWARNPDTELECYSAVHTLSSFARGEGIWQRLGTNARREQLDRMIELSTELYPRFRWFLFDGQKRYAAPVTLFGPHRCAVYLGDLYLVLTAEEHVRTIGRHLDGLITSATVQPPDVPTYLGRLRRELDR